EDVEFLPAHVFGSHVDHAFESKQRAYSSGSDAVLACTRFRDDARLAHALGEQRLSQAIVNFVCAGMEQVFALQINSGPAEFFREAAGKKKRRGPPGIIVQKIGKPLLEFAVAARLL